MSWAWRPAHGADINLDRRYAGDSLAIARGEAGGQGRLGPGAPRRDVKRLKNVRRWTMSSDKDV